MPIIHITDLFTPPGDPDDHFDLLTLLGAVGSEVAAVIIDHTVDHGVPGTAAVAKAAALYGLAPVPCAVGLHDPLASEADTATDRPLEQQAAVELIISSLRKCPDHEMIFTLVGSMRDLAAAYNREPALFRAKTARLMVNAGDSSGDVGPRDWNTALDLAAWKRMLASGLPIDWFPCNPSKGRGRPNNHVSYWSMPQNVMLGDCPAPVKSFFESESISTSDPVTRHMWSTVSFMEAARLSGRVSQKTRVPASYAMEPVTLKIDDDGTARWTVCGNGGLAQTQLLTIRDAAAYPSDMHRFLETCFNNIVHPSRRSEPTTKRFPTPADRSAKHCGNPRTRKQMINFSPDYRHFADVMRNTKPKRLPLYEHIIGTGTMERILGVAFSAMLKGNGADIDEFFRLYCGFFKEMTYDVVTFEACITEVLPGSGALSGGRPGPIQNRADFEAYPWADIPRKFWQTATPRFDALRRRLPAGMKAVGGIGNGVFEISEDLVGLEYLPFMQIDDPELYADLFTRIGDLMCTIWNEFLPRYGDAFAACRFGDDLGFKSSLLTNPRTVREHVLPQYKRVINLVHASGHPFLLHSCGCIFEVMDDIIALGIDAKHSNEDAIAPFQKWIDDYGARIGLLGGFDMDFLCSKSEDEVFASVLEQGREYRATARGYALGSGNSIPDYVPVQNYLAMVRAAQAIRSEEA